MRTVFVLALTLLTLAALALAAPKPSDKLQIGILKRAETCERAAANGDELVIHYRGTLLDGTEFDSSYSRNEPFRFRLGQGSVIKGWDQGLLGMCIGEKRKLVIPPELGYGARGAGSKIPGNSHLVFVTELVDIK